MNFTDKWSCFHNGWNIYKPQSQMYKIDLFDDGIKDFEKYSNFWFKYGDGFNGQKIALVNINDSNIQISSISAWKVSLITLNNLPA